MGIITLKRYSSDRYSRLRGPRPYGSSKATPGLCPGLSGVRESRLIGIIKGGVGTWEIHPGHQIGGCNVNMQDTIKIEVFTMPWMEVRSIHSTGEAG